LFVLDGTSSVKGSPTVISISSSSSCGISNTLYASSNNSFELRYQGDILRGKCEIEFKTDDTQDKVCVESKMFIVSGDVTVMYHDNECDSNDSDDRECDTVSRFIQNVWHYRNGSHSLHI